MNFPHFQDTHHQSGLNPHHLGMPGGSMPNGHPHHEMHHPHLRQNHPNGYVNGANNHQMHPINEHMLQQAHYHAPLNQDPNIPNFNANGIQGLPQFNNAMMAAMSNMSMNPFFQMVQESARLAVPVGTYPDDQTLLVEVLCQTTKNGLTYRQALETLHERNNHSSSLWKDYYLDHKNEIDALVEARNNPPPVRGAKKPSLKDLHPDTTPDRQAPPVARPKVKPRHSMSSIVKSEPVDSVKIPDPPARRRQTINSLTAPMPVFNSKLPAPAADIQIPPPPSRSPTPPTKVIPTARGNKYTPEDREYFINYINWRLKNDPRLAKLQLCEELAQKVPHHTANSWMSHWAIRHELADKIFAHAKKSIAEVDSSSDEDEDDDSGSDYGVSKPSSSTRPLRRPNYKDLSSSEPSEELSFDEVDNDLTDADAHGSDDDDAPRAKRTQVSTKASPLSFGDGDLRLMARHIASTPDFAELPSGERWKPFTDKHPQRSHKAWMEQYRRRKDELDKMAKQIRRKRDAENHIPVKQERSSVPLSAPPPPLPRLGVSTGSNIPPSKRKLGDFDGGPEQIKRYKDNCAE